MKKLIPALILGALLVPGAQGAITTYDSRASFISALTTSTTYNFDEPNRPVDLLDTVLRIGTIGGDTNGQIVDNTLVGSEAGGVNRALPLQFTFLTPGFAFGYDNLDLTADEEAVITFSFTSGNPSQTFTLNLGGQPDFTPTFFGAISTEEISNVQIYSHEIGSDFFDRDNTIDNVTIGEVGTVADTPEPSSLMLMSGGLLILLGRFARPRLGLVRK